MRRAAQLGFRVRANEVRNDILVPRYYDPEIEANLDGLAATHDLVSIGDLIKAGWKYLADGNVAEALYVATKATSTQVIAQVQIVISDPNRCPDETERLGDSITEPRHHPAGPLMSVYEPVPIRFGVKHFHGQYR